MKTYIYMEKCSTDSEDFLNFVSETTYGLESDECSKEENDFWEREYKKFKEMKNMKTDIYDTEKKVLDNFVKHTPKHCFRDEENILVLPKDEYYEEDNVYDNLLTEEEKQIYGI